MEPTFDEDGYPTNETLERIRTWTENDDYLALMEFVKSALAYPYAFVEERDCQPEYSGARPTREFSIATGGWSGNESVLEALENNQVFYMLSWYSSHRGGRVVYRVPKESTICCDVCGIDVKVAQNSTSTSVDCLA